MRKSFGLLLAILIGLTASFAASAEDNKSTQQANQSGSQQPAKSNADARAHGDKGSDGPVAGGQAQPPAPPSKANAQMNLCKLSNPPPYCNNL